MESLQTRLAGNAQDALSNVVVVQSFTRLNSEARLFGDIVKQVLDYQFPVLNWWAVVSVMTRAAATITVISIFLLGTLLHLDGKASVGEIVSFMGFATLLTLILTPTLLAMPEVYRRAWAARRSRRHDSAGTRETPALAEAAE